MPPEGGSVHRVTQIAPTHHCLSFRHLIIENFIPLEEKNKIVHRAFLDEEDEHWKMKPITRMEG